MSLTNPFSDPPPSRPRPPIGASTYGVPLLPVFGEQVPFGERLASVPSITIPEQEQEEVDMAAVTSAIIAGGSVFASWMGQRQATKAQKEANERAAAVLAEGEDYNRKGEHRKHQRLRNRLVGADETYRNTMAELGIPGLPDVNIPQTDPSAFEPPPYGYFPDQYSGQAPQVASASPGTGYMSDLSAPQPPGPGPQVASASPSAGPPYDPRYGPPTRPPYDPRYGPPTRPPTRPLGSLV